MELENNKYQPYRKDNPKEIYVNYNSSIYYKTFFMVKTIWKNYCEFEIIYNKRFPKP